VKIVSPLAGRIQALSAIEGAPVKAGDVVAVTGLFGKPAVGLKIMLQNLSVPLVLKKSLTDSVLMPHARLNEGLALAQTDAVTSSIFMLFIACLMRAIGT
jgi:thiamine monophosphate kinase